MEEDDDDDDDDDDFSCDYLNEFVNFVHIFKSLSNYSVNKRFNILHQLSLYFSLLS